MESIDNKVMELLELRRMADEVKGEIAAIQGEIMALMELQGVEEEAADHYKVTWKVVNSTRLDVAALKRAMPDVAQAFTRASSIRRFTVSA